MFKNIILKRIGRIDQIPTMFKSAIEIDQLLQDYNTDTSKLANLISLDPALITKVLKVANSAAYAGVAQITDVGQVITRLGFDELRKIVTTVAVLNSFPTNYIDYRKFWLHSITVAYTALHLFSLIDPHRHNSTIFTCGILHDIGILILDQYFPELYRKVFELGTKQNGNLQAAEKQVLGITSNEVAALLLEKWALPANIVTVVRNYAVPELAEEEVLHSRLLHLAVFIANNRGIDNGTGFFPDGFSDRIWDELDLSVDAIPAILERVDQDVSIAEEILHLGGNN